MVRARPVPPASRGIDQKGLYQTGAAPQRKRNANFCSDAIFAQAASAHSGNNAGSAEKRNVELENGMPEYEPVGEFGSAEWCEACGKAGAKMLQDANLPADTAWGFSETYLYPPERMLTDGREISAFHFMVKDGACSGGDGAPEECLALDGPTNSQQMGSE